MLEDFGVLYLAEIVLKFPLAIFIYFLDFVFSVCFLFFHLVSSKTSLKLACNFLKHVFFRPGSSFHYTHMILTFHFHCKYECKEFYVI